MKYLTLFITLPITLFSILFVAANTDHVSYYLYPGDTARSLPLYAIGIGLLGVGFLTGAVFVALYAQRLQFKYWAETRKSAQLEKALAAYEEKDISRKDAA